MPSVRSGASKAISATVPTPFSQIFSHMKAGTATGKCRPDGLLPHKRRRLLSHRSGNAGYGIIHQLLSGLALRVAGDQDLAQAGSGIPIVGAHTLQIRIITLSGQGGDGGSAFSFEPPLPEYMEEPPKSKNTKIMNKYMYSEIIWTGLYCAILCILFLKLPIVREFIRPSENNEYLMTAYFAMFIFMGIFNAFNARTSRINILANLSKNKVFVAIFSFIFIAQLYIIYNGGDIFRTYGLELNELILVFILALTVFPVDFLRKYILKKKHIALGV